MLLAYESRRLRSNGDIRLSSSDLVRGCADVVSFPFTFAQAASLMLRDRTDGKDRN